MLVTVFEVVLVVVGLALVALGIYGIVRDKWHSPASGGAAGATITVPLSGLVVIIGMCSLGFAVYLQANTITKNPVAALAGSASLHTASPTPIISTSPAPITASPSPSASSTISNISPTNTMRPAGAPYVRVDIPKSNAKESRAGSFTVGGTVSALGSDTIWILDYDTTGYTIDEQADINLGQWSATDGPPLGTSDDALPYRLTVGVVLANPSCTTKLNQLINSNQFDIPSLPSGCRLTGETVTVDVTQP